MKEITIEVKLKGMKKATRQVKELGDELKRASQYAQKLQETLSTLNF